ncbi:MAG: hypothetical protein HRT69_18865 [Flavobacteriaceae bacterium]|nr:hypothetical protein [Flavobacteriaceae bacterium]
MRNKKSSPLNQDIKFDTTLYDFGRQAHTMTPEEREQYRNAQANALTFTPTGGFLNLAGKVGNVIARNIGGGPFSIGQGLVRRFGPQPVKKWYDRVFSNTPAPIVPKIAPKSTNPNFDKAYNFTPKELQRVQGMNTPLTPNLTPVNPRGVETVKWAGGREVIKPGTPGRGGAPTYSAKDPLWPTFEGVNLDEIIYPRNWKSTSF